MGKLPTYFPHNVFSFRLRALPTRPTPGAEMDLLKRSRHLYVTFTDYLRPSVMLVSRVQISIAPRARSTYFAIRSHFARVCCVAKFPDFSFTTKENIAGKVLI